MGKTAVRRLLILIPQMFLLSVLIFILAHFMPGDALTGQIDIQSTSPERIEELRIRWGYYDPWYIKYYRWITNAVQGDFGRSTTFQVPVTTVIGERAVNTFWLSLFTLFLMYLIAIPLGIIAGRYHGRKVDKIIDLYTYVMLASPTVIFALMSIFIFGFRLRLFPIGLTVETGLTQGTFEFYLSRLYHMALPALTGAVLFNVGIIQYLRSEIVEYEKSGFVTTAKSKGVPGRIIYSRHITRNALIPVGSGMGYQIAGLLSGSIFIEKVFSYPGMGRLFVDSIQRRDYAVANALILLFSALMVLGTLLSDIIICYLDPRIRIK